jgi:uncharacterized protein
MDDEYRITKSPLSRKISREGTSVEVLIYRGERDKGWILEVVNQLGGSTVWDDTFETEQDALNEVFQTIAAEGMASFLQDREQKPR